MIATLSEILNKADQSGYAVIAPDFPSLFIARILIEEADAQGAPLVLSYSTSFKPMRDVTSYATFIRVVREEIEQAAVPIALHLDHGTNLDEIAEAIDLGFTSVMIDASFEPYQVNLERTLKTVAMAQPAGVSVEAELGHVTSSGDYLTEDDHASFYTEPEQAEAFAATTGIDALAVAVGSVHGLQKGAPKLDVARLQEIDERVVVPLVLHGASGFGESNIRRAVSCGIRKINMYSDMISAVFETTYQELGRQRINALKVAQVQEAAIRKMLRKYIRISGSAGV